MASVLVDFVIKGIVLGVLGGALLAFLNENLGVLRNALLIASAKRKLASPSPARVARGVHILLEIARARPTRRQEMVDVIVEEFFRRRFAKTASDPRKAPPTPPHLVGLFRDTLRALLSLPRKDDNGHGLNLDLHQLALVSRGDSIYLEKMNFDEVVLWGSDFANVDFSRSSFVGADLGGVCFDGCGLEDLDLRGARLSFSPLDERATIIHGCQVARSNLEEAWVMKHGTGQVVFVGGEVEGDRLQALRGKGGGVEERGDLASALAVGRRPPGQP
jgi:hypothetical protein